MSLPEGVVHIVGKGDSADLTMRSTGESFLITLTDSNGKQTKAEINGNMGSQVQGSCYDLFRTLCEARSSKKGAEIWVVSMEEFQPSQSF